MFKWRLYTADTLKHWFHQGKQLTLISDWDFYNVHHSRVDYISRILYLAAICWWLRSLQGHVIPRPPHPTPPPPRFSIPVNLNWSEVTKTDVKISSHIKQLLSSLLLLAAGVMRRVGMSAESCAFHAGARSSLQLRSSPATERRQTSVTETQKVKWRRVWILLCPMRHGENTSHDDSHIQWKPSKTFLCISSS